MGTSNESLHVDLDQEDEEYSAFLSKHLVCIQTTWKSLYHCNVKYYLTYYITRQNIGVFFTGSIFQFFSFSVNRVRSLNSRTKSCKNKLDR